MTLQLYTHMYVTDSIHLSQRLQQHIYTGLSSNKTICQGHNKVSYVLCVQLSNQSRLGHYTNSCLAWQSLTLMQHIGHRGQLISSIISRMCQNMILVYRGAILVRSDGNTNSNSTKKTASPSLIWYEPCRAYPVTAIFVSGYVFLFIPMNSQFCEKEREKEWKALQGNVWSHCG